MRFQEFVGDLITIFWQVRSKAFQIWWCYISWLDQMSHLSRKLHKDHGCDTLDMPAPILSGQHPVYHFLSILRRSSLFHTSIVNFGTPPRRKFTTKMPKWPKKGQNFSFFLLKNSWRKWVHHRRFWGSLLIWACTFQITCSINTALDWVGQSYKLLRKKWHLKTKCKLRRRLP